MPKTNEVIGEHVNVQDIHRQREIHEIEFREAVQNESQVLRVSGKPRPKGHAYTAITVLEKGDR